MQIKVALFFSWVSSAYESSLDKWSEYENTSPRVLVTNVKRHSAIARTAAYGDHHNRPIEFANIAWYRIYRSILQKRRINSKWCEERSGVDLPSNQPPTGDPLQTDPSRRRTHINGNLPLGLKEHLNEVSTFIWCTLRFKVTHLPSVLLRP